MIDEDIKKRPDFNEILNFLFYNLQFSSIDDLK